MRRNHIYSTGSGRNQYHSHSSIHSLFTEHLVYIRYYFSTGVKWAKQDKNFCPLHSSGGTKTKDRQTNQPTAFQIVESALKETSTSRWQAVASLGEVSQVWTRNDTCHDRPFVEQWRVKVRVLEPDCLWSNPCSALANYMTQNKLLNFSGLQYPQM